MAEISLQKRVMLGLLILGGIPVGLFLMGEGLETVRDGGSVCDPRCLGTGAETDRYGGAIAFGGLTLAAAAVGAGFALASVRHREVALEWVFWALVIGGTVALLVWMLLGPQVWTD